MKSRDSDLEAVGVLVVFLHLVLLGMLRHILLLDLLIDDPNIALLIKFSFAFLEEILELEESTLAILGFLFGLLVLILELVELSQPFLNTLLSQSLLGLLICDLSLGSSPLDSSFEHVCCVSFGSYKITYAMLAV